MRAVDSRNSAGVWAIRMDAHDFAAYLALRAPVDLPWSQTRNLARIRRAIGRPISLAGYEAIQSFLARLEAEDLRLSF